MIRQVWKSAEHALRALLYGVVGGFVVAVVLLVFQLNGRPDLKVWHTAHLDVEFTPTRPSKIFLNISHSKTGSSSSSTRPSTNRSSPRTDAPSTGTATAALRIPGTGREGDDHELVLFDLNRNSHVESVLKRNPSAWLHDILRSANKSFTLSVMTNEGQNSRTVVLRQRRPGETEITQAELGLSWPQDIYSLAHVALPFPPDDPSTAGPTPGMDPEFSSGISCYVASVVCSRSEPATCSDCVGTRFTRT